MSKSNGKGEASDAPDNGEGPLSLPGQIVSDIIEQAPVYGLSGAIFAVGMVTGRRALARSGANMLVAQLIGAMTRATVDRLLPGGAEAAADTPPAIAKAADAPPAETRPKPAQPGNLAVAAGALMGVAAAAGGGWLVSRLLARKPAADDQD